MIRLITPDKEFKILLAYYGLYNGEAEGELYKVLCPFHGDINPSMQINLQTSFFCCYGCGAHGSSIELFKHFYFLDNPNKKLTDVQCISKMKQLVKKLVEKSIQCNIDKNNDRLYNTIYEIYSSDSQVLGNSFSEKENPKLLSAKESLMQAKNFYYNLPTPNWFRPSSVSSVEEETRMCNEYMKKRGFSPVLLKHFGAKASLNSFYPIVFPLLENGVFRGYVMRTFDPQVEANRKYMYNRGFRREKTLAGEYEKKKPIILVEGYLDKLKASQIGIKNVSAILGWKASEIQLKRIQRAGIKDIICALDHDEAGEKGYLYLKRVSSIYGFSVFRLRYPKGIKDMGDIQKGSKEEEKVKRQIERFLE